MTFAALLNEDQKQIWTEEREVLQRTLDVLSNWEAAPADLEHLRRALQQLEELFLLVVVGERSSDKSALINALLGEAFRHEAIARDFVPRRDLVLFVTSVDRPFTESERAFLESIRQRGK